MKYFKGGIHPRDKKDCRFDKIQTIPLPKRIFLPLRQHTGSQAVPLVKAGDLVAVGQMVASASGFISANIHSPVSGKVVSIEKILHPCGFGVDTIVIDSDGKHDTTQFQSVSPEDLSIEQLLDTIKNAGITGLGGGCFPTHVKLSPPKEKKVESMILNGCECEPYLSCDHRVMLEEPKKVLEGLRIMMKVLAVNNAFIAVEDNKKDAIEVLRKSLGTDKDIIVVKLRTRYPQGAEKQLIKTISGREVPSGGLPVDAGFVVHNVQTAVAVGDAVYRGKPLYERVVTVAGCVRNPGNYRVLIGTPISDVIAACGGIFGEVKKIVLGGPMMGVGIHSLDVPVVKGVSGILVLGNATAKTYEPSSCIRCGRCVSVCPMGLVPMMLSRLAEKGMGGELKDYSIFDCIECGCCAYECPAKINLVQNIKTGKFLAKRHPIKSQVKNKGL
ncbi:MAG: Electron transport complex protein RnfC [Elusimicrobia bacterium ADurb.Bin231]|nr:MAG: Electron transport complex protein RnfC [Elusimicrobia bacterium ADurb.Bin231]